MSLCKILDSDWSIMVLYFCRVTLNFFFFYLGHKMLITLNLVPFVRNSLWSDEKLLKVPADVIGLNGRPVELPDVSDDWVNKWKSFLQKQKSLSPKTDFILFMQIIISNLWHFQYLQVGVQRMFIRAVHLDLAEDGELWEETSSWSHILQNIQGFVVLLWGRVGEMCYRQSLNFKVIPLK